MKGITNGSLCGDKGDFLAWDPDQWNVTKESVRYLGVDLDHLCFFYGASKLIQIGRDPLTETMDTGAKLGDGRLPNVDTDEALNNFYDF